MQLPKSFTTVTTLSKILAIILFASLPFAGFYFGIKYKSLMSEETVVVESLAKPDTDSSFKETILNSKIDWGANLVYSKDYGSYQIGLFDTEDFLEGTFVIAPIEDDLPVIYNGSFIISSFIDNGNDVLPNFFDVVDNNIYILDPMTGNINTYISDHIPKTTYFPSSFKMVYQGQIERSKYGVGSVHEINCDNNLCRVSTIKNPSSGCDMELNMLTKQYSNIKCTDMRGEFVPKLIKN